MRKRVLAIILRVAQSVGLFALARLLTARDLRILCYHGGALRDEHDFSPGLFMSKDTFAARMEFLSRHRYPVLGLDEAVANLEKGTWPRCGTVITIDDGWFGSYQIMAPILRDHRFPATLYIASYYLEKQTQVFNVAANYALWLARDQVLRLSLISDQLLGDYRLADNSERGKARELLTAFADSLNGASERQRLFRQLCAVLGLDAADLERSRICMFLTLEEARDLERHGVDVQLHTHRHSFPPDNFERAKSEIEQNRRTLALLGDRPRRHFCYPSGDYERHQLAWLTQFGIVSATTIKAGFTRPGASPYELRRFLDSERVSQLEFEAEMCGFFELVRRCGYAI
jgi:peptidoglycan/xylan/chitin deacetylase (PgdA/CDA1 family)